MKLSSLRPPRLRTQMSEEDHRSATWLELFYDLVFVVAVAALGHRLLVDHSWLGVAAFIGLFIPLWWSWASFTFYADRYDTDDLGQRLLAVAQMIAIALMAASISGDTADSTVAFAGSFLAARVVLLIMYLRAYFHVETTRQLVHGYLVGFSIGAMPWIVSLWVPEPWRYVLWAIGLAIDMATPYVMRRAQAMVPLSVSHLPERFGLFTILVLGESIAAVVAGLSSIGWEFNAAMGAVIGVITATGLWWLYFDNLEGSVVRRRSSQLKAWRPTTWIYMHLPLAIGLTASGIGLEFLVAQEGADVRWVAVTGIAISLAAMGGIHLATDREDHRTDLIQFQVRLGSAALVVLIGVAAGAWSSNTILFLLAGICFIQVGVDIFLRERSLQQPSTPT
ncbi:MAG: low temperature requirement protein A [Actinomycetia bacterium]|nr:low temperature requirement protein A [Actinomycetes bacterium]